MDTSCYTTSVACVDEEGIVYDKRTVLSVDAGQRGVRQSDGVFIHVRNLGTLLPEMLCSPELRGARIKGVAVSATPRPVQDSYMPVFLAGKTAAASVAAALDMPLIETTHQQGHIRAAMLDREEMLDRRLLGMHISGGTTEIFGIEPYLEINLLGGTGDLHAGQFVDRLGVSLGLPFPCGKYFERLAVAHSGSFVKLPSSVDGLNCSFSGVETRAQELIKQGTPPAEIAMAAYDVMARTFAKLLHNAAEKTGVFEVLLAGGVASSALLRKLLYERLKGDNIMLYFGRTELSSDNAVGVACIGRDTLNSNGDVSTWK